MNEAIQILNEKFELNLKDSYLEENLLKNLESQKIKIFTIFNSSPNSKFIKIFVSKVWNLCRMLNYTRNIKDNDNNHFILRLKDFLCDLFILIFTSFNEITLHDVFNLIQLVTEVGTAWIKLDIKMSLEGWVKRIDNIMKYLISKINDVENIINLDRKFYFIFMDYLNFYVESFIINKIDNCSIPKTQISTDCTENKCEDILKIIILIKNIKFIENDISTKNLIFNFLIFLKKIYYSFSQIEDALILCEGFESVKYKILLSFDVLTDFYKFYIQILLSINNYETSEIILKNLLEYVPHDSKEEIECYLLNLEIICNSSTQNTNNDKINDIIEIIFEHKEFNLEFLEDVLLLATNLNFNDCFFEIFFIKLKNLKNLKLFSNINFNYEILKNYKILCLLFIYSFFKSKFFNFIIDGGCYNELPERVQGSHASVYIDNPERLATHATSVYSDTPERPPTRSTAIISEHLERPPTRPTSHQMPGLQQSSTFNYNLVEILKVFSQSLLENFTNYDYNEEQSNLIPLILKNLVILFLKLEKILPTCSDNFSSYFLLEIIKKISPEKEKEFVEMSLEIYVDRKDYLKLKNIVKELEEKNITKKSLFYYCQIILQIKDGSKWNSNGQINFLCLNLNLSDDFNIIFYLKIFNFIFDNNMNDFNIISTILQNFSLKFFEILNNRQFDKLNIADNNSKNNLSFFEILHEIILFYHKLNKFSSQIVQFMEFLNIIGNQTEFIKINENKDESFHYLTNNITIVLDIINILLNYKQNIQSKQENKVIFSQKLCEDYPEFILIFSCKILNFFFNNFYNFYEEFFKVDESLIKDQIKNLLDIFELYKNLSLFYFSYEFNNLINSESNKTTNSLGLENPSINNNQIIKFKDLAFIQDKYIKSFSDAILVLKKKFSHITEFIILIDERIDHLNNSTKNIESILKVQIISKTESDSFFEEYVMDFISNYIENKKFLFVINSIIFQNGNKNLSYNFIKKLLNNILNLFQELVPKFYTLEEIFTLYKDLINLSDILINKINSIKEFTAILIKVIAKIDGFIINDNIEWILYKIFTLLDNNGHYKVNKSEKEFILIKQIYEDLSNINMKNRSYMLNNLFDIVLKKLLI